MTLVPGNLLENFRPTPWPEDFGLRLERLKVLTGLKWKEFAPLLGVSERAILLWRRGERRPSGANILALTQLARIIPGGIDVLCQGDAGALTLWVRGSGTEDESGE